MVEDLAAGFGDEDQVFDADADAFLGEVDAGFYGEALAGLNEGLVDGGDVAGFVDLQADGVAGAVGELGAVALPGDVVPGGLVYVAHAVAGLGGGNAPAVGFFDDLINFPLPGGHFS